MRPVAHSEPGAPPPGVVHHEVLVEPIDENVFGRPMARESHQAVLGCDAGHDPKGGAAVSREVELNEIHALVFPRPTEPTQGQTPRDVRVDRTTMNQRRDSKSSLEKQRQHVSANTPYKPVSGVFRHGYSIHL